MEFSGFDLIHGRGERGGAGPGTGPNIHYNRS